MASAPESSSKIERSGPSVWGTAYVNEGLSVLRQQGDLKLGVLWITERVRRGRIYTRSADRVKAQIDDWMAVAALWICDIIATKKSAHIAQ